MLNNQFEKLTTMELSLPKVNSNQLNELANENLIIEINSAEEVIINGKRLSEFSLHL